MPETIIPTDQTEIRSSEELAELFAAMAVVQFFIVLSFFPETRGVSLEQMQKKLGIA